MRRFFLDTEFVEDGQTIMPISLALVSQGGGQLYLEFHFDEKKANAHHFVRDNVLPHLRGQERYTKEQARDRILGFVGRAKEIEFWAYYADYDWVLFCQIFGTMMELPFYWPKFCFDLQQHYVLHAAPMGVKKPPPPQNQHDALADALWNRGPLQPHVRKGRMRRAKFGTESQKQAAHPLLLLPGKDHHRI